MRAGTHRILRSAAFVVVAGLFAGSAAHADPFTWTGAGTDATGDGAPAPTPDEVTAGELPFRLWTASDNWTFTGGDSDGVPDVDDSAHFGPTLPVGGSTNVAFNTPISIHTMTIGAGPVSGINYEFEAYGAGKLTLASGGAITLLDNSPGIPFVTPIDLAGSATISNSATLSSFNFTNSPITGLAAGSTLNVNVAGGTANQFGVITGPISLSKTGSGGALSFFAPMTYTGSTLLAGPSNLVKVDNALPTTTILTLGTATQNGILRLDNGSSIELAGLQLGAGITALTSNGINANSDTLTSNVTINSTQHTAFNGRLGATGTASRNMNLIKTGPAAFTLYTTAHTYTGTTSVNGGTLEIESGNINLTSGITINGGRLIYSSPTTLSSAVPITVTAGTIGGTGTIARAVSIGANATISPGGDVSPTGVLSETTGTQTYSGGLTLASGGTYHYDVNASTNDVLAGTGANAINIAATTDSKFAIDISATGLGEGVAVSRTIATSAAAITTFDANKFAVIGGGAGTVSLLNPNTLVVNFTTLQPIYWDIDGAGTAGAGGATPGGAWDGAAVNFNTDATGAGAGTTTAATAGHHVVNFAAGAGATGAYTVTLTGTQSAAAVNIGEGNVSLTGGTLATGVFDVASGATGSVASVVTGNPIGTVVKRGTGTLTLAAANTHSGGTTVEAGTLVLAHADALGTGNLAVSTGATAQAQAGLPKALSVASVTTAGTGKLDLTNNDLVVKSSTVAAVQALLLSGFNGGTWDGPGIQSSAAATDPNGFTALGYLSNADLGATEFSGVPVDADDVLVKYTYYGDADLSGNVTLDDYSQFLFGFQNPVAASWSVGDFDYSGTVTLDDFSVFLLVFQNQGGPLGGLAEAISADTGLSEGSRAAMLGAIAAVPEPGTLGVLALAGIGMLGRRRRR